MDTAGDSVENPGLMTTASGIGIQHGFGVCEGTLLSAIRFAAFPFSLFIIIESLSVVFVLGPANLHLAVGRFSLWVPLFFGTILFRFIVIVAKQLFRILGPRFRGRTQNVARSNLRRRHCRRCGRHITDDWVTCPRWR